MRSYYSNIGFKKLTEDLCDTCVRLNVSLKYPDLSEEDKEELEKQKAIHNSEARNLRRALREAVRLWGHENIEVDGSDEGAKALLHFDSAVDRLENEVDFPSSQEKTDCPPSLRVELEAQDYGVF